MKAIDFLEERRIYDDETLYNSADEMVGTLSELMEEYAQAQLKNCNLQNVTGSMFAITETDNYGRTVMHCCFKLKYDAEKHLRDNKRYYEGCEVTEHKYCL